ncbi:MAG: hypothetical protein U0R19_39270 [Bryobacteraceae bacterium]
MTRRLLLSSLLLSSAVSAAWNIEVVASNVLPDLAATPKLQAAFRRVWMPTPIGPMPFDYTAIAFEDQVTGFIKLARRVGTGSWTVDSLQQGRWPSVALDKYGAAHVTYYSPNASWVPVIVHAKYSPGAGNCGTSNNYTCNVVKQPDTIPVASHNSEVRVGDDDSIHVMFDNGSSSMYLRKTPADAGFVWQASPHGGPFSIQLDSTNRLHTVMQSAYIAQYPTLIEHDAWNPFQVMSDTDTGINLPRLASVLDSSNRAHTCLTSTGGSASPLKYGWEAPPSPYGSVSTVSSGYATDCSIALKSDGTPGISYRNTFVTGVLYAEKITNFWSIEYVDTQDNVGFSSSLVMNASSKPMIAYYDRTYNRVKFARSE